MIEMSEALNIINAHMHEGRCPSAGCIGECAAMTEIRPGIWWAALYIWDKEFNDSTRVAKWFADIGATDILITHVLHDTDNGDKDGACFDGARAWHVEFAISGIAVDNISKAANDVLAERERQIQQEGWSAAHDDEHNDGELCCAGAAYALNAGCVLNPHSQQPLDGAPEFWPWHGTDDVSGGRGDTPVLAQVPVWWKPKDPRRDLVRAAALIIAEIERMDRKEGAA